MRLSGKVLNLAVLIGLIGILLTATSASGDPNTPTYGQFGELDLRGSDTGVDRFVFTPDGGGTPSVETFSSNNQAKLSEDNLPVNLVAWAGDGPVQGQLPYVGLKDHTWGVRARGEGSGTPAVQVNDTGADGQVLEIALDGSVTGDKFANYAQLGFKFKFGASVLVEAFNGATFIDSVIASCTGNDCGADSGNDRINVEIGDPLDFNPDHLFTRLVISISTVDDTGAAAPDDGAVSLIDEPDASDPLVDFDTWINLVREFDGDLDCEESATENDLGSNAVFTRLDDGSAAAGCGTEKLYNLDIVPGTEVQFVPEVIASVDAIYRFDLELTGTLTSPLSNELEYDRDGAIGGDNFVPMQWCQIIDAVPPLNHTFAGGALYFPELDDLGPSSTPAVPVDGFPTLPTYPVGHANEGELIPDLDGGDPTSCIVAFSTLADGSETWVGFLDGEDPFYR